MIGSGLQKYAKENGMQVSHGVAYGALQNFAATLSEGSGYKQIVVATKFSDPAKLQELQQVLNQNNISREYRVKELNFTANGVSIVFNDTVGTMKKIEAFVAWFFPLLQQYGASPYNVCAECGMEAAGGSWKLMDDVAYYMHPTCAEKVRLTLEEEAAAQEEADTGTYANGVLGALLGAALGAVVWAAVLLFGYVASIVGFLIGWLAEKGYNLLHGKQGKGKVVILVIAVIFGVIAGTIAADVVSLVQMINAEELPGLVYSDIPAIMLTLLEDSEYVAATVENILMGLLFAFLGVFAMLRQTGKAVAKTKIIDLP